FVFWLLFRIDPFGKLRTCFVFRIFDRNTGVFGQALNYRLLIFYSLEEKVLVRFFRNPILLKVVGTVVALAFLSPLVGRKNMIKFVLPALIVLLLFMLMRSLLLKRKRKLTIVEKEYLKKRFYH
ncbi:MAG: hypothetical protein KAR43_05195, partial [Deltaproteobacteria bacterium]|nr:hypothetical protein [Deltaproteobacteria bacterium]